MKKVIVLVLLLCSAVLAQKTYPPPGLSPTTFANLGTPANGAAFYCSDCAATAPCTGSGTGANAYRVAGAWNCNTGAAGGTPGGSPGQVQFNDTTFGGDATFTFDKTTKILSASQLLAASRSTTGSIVHTGAGLSDLSKSGIFTGIAGVVYTITIDAADVPDTFHWDDGAGGHGNDGVAITGTAQALSNGVSITFAATTGHTLADSWSFTTTATPGIVVKNPAGTSKVFLAGDSNLFAGHVSIGSSPDFGANDPIFEVREDASSSAEDAVLASVFYNFDSTINGSNVFGFTSTMFTQGSHNFYRSTGAHLQARHNSSGTLNRMEGARIDAFNYASGGLVSQLNVLTLEGGALYSGDVTLQRTLWINAPRKDGSGSVLNPVGIQIEDQNITGAITSYNILSKGATSLNDFEGIVRNDTLTASTIVGTDASKNLVSVATTGTGNAVLSNSPTLVTPTLGTPASVTLTNGTGLPISTGISGLGSNVATFLGSSSSATLAAAVTDETGSGALVFAASPAFTGSPTVNGASIATVGSVGSVLSVLSSNATLATATGTTYSSPGYGGTPMAATSEATVGWVCPRAGTIGTLYIITGSVAKVNTPVTTVTIRKNGADTTVTLTLTQTTATVSSDVTHTFTVAAGDTITLSFATTGVAAVSTSIAGVSFLLN